MMVQSIHPHKRTHLRLTLPLTISKYSYTAHTMAAAIGENGTLQHTWDFSNWKNTFTQFYFQLVRGSLTNTDMHYVFKRLLNIAENDVVLKKYLLRLVVQTRDIQKGKGERDLYYQLLTILADNNHLTDAINILQYTCSNDAGSWKDIKYIVFHLLSKSTDIYSVSTIHPLAKAALQLLSTQIQNDYKAYTEDRFSDMSLAPRWAPRREKGKFFPVTRLFVQTIHASKKFKSSSMKAVRQMLALLNRDLRTPQIDMCRGTWRLLNFNSMTSYTLLKNKLAFQNKTKKGEDRSAKDDRVECATHYSDWLNSKDKKMNVSTIFPFEFVRDVMTKKLNADERKYYNDAWTTQLNAQMDATKDAQIGIMIPMIDVSGSMNCDNSLPMYNAIALGMRLAEMNTGVFHNQALTFESTPSWVQYRDDQTFCEKVHMTKRLRWGGSTNFSAALQMVLRKVVSQNIPPLAVKNSSIVVFSDMQMDKSSNDKWSTVYENMARMYRDAGMKSIYETPYEVPHVVFWNMRKTNGFPTIGNEPGVTMISGYNATMIEVLMNKGVGALRQMTPWELIQNMLNNERFCHTT